MCRLNLMRLRILGGPRYPLSDREVFATIHPRAVTVRLDAGGALKKALRIGV